MKMTSSARTRVFGIATGMAAAVLVCLLSRPLAAQTDGGESLRTITVTGQGEVRVVPDVAQITVGVETQAGDASEALAANSQAMSKLTETLKDSGIEPKNIQTTSFNVSPQYRRQRPDNESTIDGYRVTNQVTITTDDIDSLGELLDKVVSVGANRVQGISFQVGDPSEGMNKARRQAVEDAAAKARVLADAAKVELGRVQTINESASGPVGPMPMRMAEASAVPISRGEQSLAAQVSVTFAIAD